MFFQPLFLEKRYLFFQRKGTVIKRSHKIFVGCFFEIFQVKPFAADNLVYAYVELIREKRQHFHVGHIVAVFPTGNGFIGHAEFFSEFFLR